MPRSLRVGSIAPLSLVVDHIEVGAGLTIIARPKVASARHPRCEGASSRMHNRYTRALSDLPVAGRRVVIRVSVRRFRCVGPECRTKIFAKRLEPNLAAAYARRRGSAPTRSAWRPAWHRCAGTEPLCGASSNRAGTPPATPWGHPPTWPLSVPRRAHTAVKRASNSIASVPIAGWS